MPDESCRSCGGTLNMHSQCSGCRKAVQKICQRCRALTRKQFHDRCEKHAHVTSAQTVCVLETATKKHAARPRSLRSIPVIIGIAGFFILGFATAAYIDLFENFFPDMRGVEQDGAPSPEHVTGSQNVLENCLAYGSGQSVTVTCPTQYGYMYKAILGMPKDLASKFSDSVFSIRGVSLIENSDATVVLQYQNVNYLTGFFGI